MNSANLRTLRDRAYELNAQITPVTGKYHFVDLNWAYQLLRASPSEHREQHEAEAADLIRRATGLDVDAGIELMRNARNASSAYADALRDAFTEDAKSANPEIPDDLRAPVEAYARAFLMLPDEALRHVESLPEDERGRWFFGFWTAPTMQG